SMVRQRGAPAYLRSDNGPEFIAAVLRTWLSQEGVGALYIEPGAPWQNGYAESFNGKVEDELVKDEEFASVLEARVLAQEWQRDYNEVRPRSSLGYRTPAEFAVSCPRVDSAALRPRGHDGNEGIDSDCDWYINRGQVRSKQVRRGGPRRLGQTLDGV